MTQRLALIIGNSVYRDQTLSRLVTPDVDVGDLADLLLDKEIGNFDDVKVLANMSFSAVRSAISSFFLGKKRDDLLLLYFSGHGVLDDRGRLYLAVKDTNTKLLRDRAISANFITDEMNNSFSQRQVLILDCCHSGAFARGTKGQTGASVGTASAFAGTGYGRVVMTASDATQYAWEGDQVIGMAQNSLFTHFLVQGLRTGEADINRDGKITVDELFDFVYERVVTQTPKQTPGKWSYKERGEIILALHPIVPMEPEISLLPIEKEREIDEEFERDLEKIYLRGLSAYHLEEWEKAATNFKAIKELQPDFRDVAAKLEEAERQQKLASLYKKIVTFQEKNDWQAALSIMEELIVIAPGYKDISVQIKKLRTQKKLFDLYDEAQQLFNAEQWKAVINIFSKIEAIQPNYPDDENLKTIASQKLSELERQTKLNHLYEKALIEMGEKKWDEALKKLNQIREMHFGYEQSNQLIAKVEEEISKAKTESVIGTETEVPLKEGLEDHFETIQTEDDLESLNEIGVDQQKPAAVEPPLSAKAERKGRHILLKKFALLAPVVILFVILKGWPVLGTFWLSFHDYTRYYAPEYIGLENYSRIFSGITWDQAAFNVIGLIIIRGFVVFLVWILLRTFWRRGDMVPIWVVLMAITPLPFLFSPGNQVSWFVFGGNFGLFINPPSLTNPRWFHLVIDGLNTFAVSTAIGLLIYALIQRMYKPGTKLGLEALNYFRKILLTLSAVSAFQMVTPSLVNSRFILPGMYPFRYQETFSFGQGGAISTILIILVILCAWILWKLLKTTSLKLVWLKDSMIAKQNISKTNVQNIILGILPGIIIFFPYISFLIIGLASGFVDSCEVIPNLFCEWSWSNWFLNNLLFPGLVIWTVQLPVALLTGYVITFLKLPGRNTKKRITGILVFSGILGNAVISNMLTVIWLFFTGGPKRKSLLLWSYSGLAIILFIIFFNSFSNHVKRAKEEGKSDWKIFKQQIFPELLPLIFLMGIVSTYIVSQSIFEGGGINQWNAGFSILYMRGFNRPITEIPLYVFSLAFPCAVTILFFGRVLLKRFAVSVDPAI